MFLSIILAGIAGAFYIILDELEPVPSRAHSVTKYDITPTWVGLFIVSSLIMTLIFAMFAYEGRGNNLAVGIAAIATIAAQMYSLGPAGE